MPNQQNPIVVKARWLEVTPFGEGPKCLIRDGDSKFGAQFAAVAEAPASLSYRLPASRQTATQLLNDFCEAFAPNVLTIS